MNVRPIFVFVEVEQLTGIFNDVCHSVPTTVVTQKLTREVQRDLHRKMLLVNVIRLIIESALSPSSH